MRISTLLPSDPSFHATIANEVAVLDLIHRHTTIRVPQVIAFDPLSRNELGAAWMLMEFMSGVSLGSVWREMGWGEKGALVEKVAVIVGQLFRLRGNRNGIGGVHSSDPEIKVSAPSPIYISNTFPRSRRRPILRRLFSARDVPTFLSNTASKRKSSFCSEQLSRTFTAEAEMEMGTRTRREHCCLYHANLDFNHVLVDPQTYEIKAILGWGSAAVVPLRKACTLPAFLDGRNNASTREDSGGEPAGQQKADEVDADGKTVYEMMGLRDIFLESMRVAEPAWVETYMAEGGA